MVWCKNTHQSIFCIIALGYLTVARRRHQLFMQTDKKGVWSNLVAYQIVSIYTLIHKNGGSKLLSVILPYVCLFGV